MAGSTSSSQSSTPTPGNVGNGVVNPSEGPWNQVDTLQNNGTPAVWNGLPAHSVASAPVSTNSVSREYNVTSSGNTANTNNGINILSNQVVYSSPNYMNVPYQRNIGNTGYINLNPSGEIKPQITNGLNFQSNHNGQIIGGQAWPNQSALGKFIAQSPGWTSNKPTGGVKKQKRIRTAFTSQQMMELEQEYTRSRYLDRARRIELAGILRLHERTIKIWFQNRRMKEKKDRAETLEESEDAVTSVSSPEIGNPQMLIHQQYPGINNNGYCQPELYNQGSLYVENYPVTSTPIHMPGTSQPHSMPAASLQPSMSMANLGPMISGASLAPAMPRTSQPSSLPMTNLGPMISGTSIAPAMPVTSQPTSLPMASRAPSTSATSVPSSMPAQSSIQTMYQHFMEEEQCVQYHQLHLQMQPCQPSYMEVQETSPEAKLKEEHSSSDNVEKNWDLSWIRSSLSYEDLE